MVGVAKATGCGLLKSGEWLVGRASASGDEI